MILTESVLEMIKKVTVFMMIGKMILNLGIGKEYEKYTKLIISLMAVIQIWSGVKNMVQTISVEGIFTEKNQFYEAWEEERRRFEEQLYEQQGYIEEIWNKEEAKKEEAEQNSSDKGIKIRIEKIKIP